MQIPYQNDALQITCTYSLNAQRKTNMFWTYVFTLIYLQPNNATAIPHRTSIHRARQTYHNMHVLNVNGRSIPSVGAHPQYVNVDAFLFNYIITTL